MVPLSAEPSAVPLIVALAYTASASSSGTSWASRVTSASIADPFSISSAPAIMAKEKINKALNSSVVITTTAYTAVDKNYILVDDATAGGVVTITLPAVSGVAGRIYRIKKLGATANVVIDANGAELIDGATTATLTAQYEALEVYTSGTAVTGDHWHIF